MQGRICGIIGVETGDVSGARNIRLINQPPAEVSRRFPVQLLHVVIVARTTMTSKEIHLQTTVEKQIGA